LQGGCPDRYTNKPVKLASNNNIKTNVMLNSTRAVNRPLIAIYMIKSGVFGEPAFIQPIKAI